MKHTPGPWHVLGKIISGPGCDQWGPIATLSDNARFDAKANAALISTAPELLECLRLMVHAIDKMDDSRRIDLPLLSISAKTLIARATGGGE